MQDPVVPTGTGIRGAETWDARPWSGMAGRPLAPTGQRLRARRWPATVVVAIFFVAYQQLENYLIAPRILRHTVSMSAAAVLLAALIGGTVLGLVGALMAIPIAAALKVVLAEQLHARDAADTDTALPQDGDAVVESGTAH